VEERANSERDIGGKGKKRKGREGERRKIEGEKRK